MVLLPKVSTWLEKFKSLSKRPLSQDESGVMITVMMNDIVLSEEMMQDFMLQVVLARAKMYNASIEPGLAVLLAVLCKGLPGNATMYVAALAADKIARNPDLSKKTILELDMTSFTNVCPFGIPSEIDMGVLWDMQKDHDGPGDNFLDRSLVA